MFLGNDFGTLQTFEKLKGYENAPTWRWLRHRLRIAGIPGELGFYTNAYLGLRSDRPANAVPLDDPDFDCLCAEFLGVQIKYQSPRLIVALGRYSARLLGKVLRPSQPFDEAVQRCRYEGNKMGVVKVHHPFYDQYSKARRQEQGEILARAWATAGPSVAT